MHREIETTLSDLIRRMASSSLKDSDVIPWSSPVPSFGDLEVSEVATLGLNPSNREFVDDRGRELQGEARRFHTLNSLGINNWSDVSRQHIHEIFQRCQTYFSNNPYDRWFRRLDYLLEDTGSSYYRRDSHACHLDLIPYATASKWTELSLTQRTLLMRAAADTLGLLLRSSPIQVLILNGRTVIETLQQASESRFHSRTMRAWTLPRNSGTGVPGIAYWGSIDRVGGISLHRRIIVLGYNHNIQSSFGVTTAVQNAIRTWIGQQTRAALNETERHQPRTGPRTSATGIQ